MESLVRYVWKHRLFPLAELKTTDGLPIEVIQPGLENRSDGPDFFNANLKVAYDFDLSSELTLQLHAGVQNIFNAYQTDFDQGPNRDSGYIYGPSLPRSFFFGVKFDFR